MQTLKKLALGFALAIILALSCGGVLAAELVIVATEAQLATEGVQGWLGLLAELGVPTRVVSGADFEAVKTSPYLAVLASVNTPECNEDLIPLMVTSVTTRIDLGTQNNRKLFCYENKFAEGQLVLLFTTPLLGGMSNPNAGVFHENRDEWEARLRPLMP